MSLLSASGASATIGLGASGASFLVVISGLPRSGTSLMMQMLAAGGLPPLRDDARAPDAGNPRGYFEWAPARALARDPGAIAAARGRAVKVISALLPALPREHRYRVVFMERDAREIEASQRALLALTGAPVRDGVAAHAATQTPHGDGALAKLRARVTERQAAVGFGGDYRAWIERVTPPDLE